MTSPSTVKPAKSSVPSATPSSALEQNDKFQTETQKSEQSPIRRARILNSFFDIVTTQDTVEWIVHQIKTNQRSYICTVNVAILMMMRSLPCLAQFAAKAGLIVADGQPIIWASHWLKNPLPERVTGIDLIAAIAERAQTEGFSIYCLGANSATIEQAVANLRAKYPKLTIHFADGYFTDAQAGDRVAAVRHSGAHILFVGMGVPKQEDFLAEHWDALGVNVAIGVGGSFNVIAGVQHRAPEWVQELGLEWFYRLMQEPQRLWKRYLTTGGQFAIALTKQLLVKRLFNRPSIAE
jgi:N-acetylglucosaminyldiphosphoundecaprenol N-acetyl-beta-D-mannosaminyltransferase